MRFVSLKDNQLTDLPVDSILRLTHLKKLELQNNPLPDDLIRKLKTTSSKTYLLNFNIKNPNMNNPPKTAVITGVSTGIGLGIAKELAQRGYKVFGSVRKESDAEKVKQAIGANYIPLIMDVTDEEAILKAAEKVKQELGNEGLGVLINNSGIAEAGPLMHQPIDEIKQQFEVNIFGLLRVTQVFLPLLGARENHNSVRGKILNISSVGGKIAAPFIGAYVGSKHALEGMSHTLRRELLIYGIDVIIIGPGAVKTPIWEKVGDLDRYKHTIFDQSIRNFAYYFIAEKVMNNS